MDVLTFIEELNNIKSGEDLFHMELSCNLCYAYDVKADKRTYLSSDSNDAVKGLVINNKKGSIIHHICVDGGMVEYGLWDYIGDGKKHGRNDCMLFDDTLLLFVEFKMESTTERDRGMWSLFSEGMNQIREYYLYLKKKLMDNGISITGYFSEDYIVPFICMKNIPSFKPKVNAQRMAEMERFRIATNLKIQYGITFDF